MIPTRRRRFGLVTATAMALTAVAVPVASLAADSPDTALDASAQPEPVRPTEGMCSLVDLASVNRLSTFRYGPASGGDIVCTYMSLMDFDGFYTATVALNTGSDLETYEQFYGADQELEVDGHPAFLSGDQLFVAYGDHVLQTSAGLFEGETAGWDAIAQAIGLAELYLPALSDLPAAATWPTAEPTPGSTPEVSLCQTLPLDELDSITGLGFDDASGDYTSCQVASSDGEPGDHFVCAYVTELALDDYRPWLLDAIDATVAGLPAIVTENQTIVELPGGGRVLDVTVSLDAADTDVTMTAAEVGALIAERVVPGIPAGETPAESGLVTGDPGIPEQPEPSLVMCDYVDPVAINALGILEYSEVSGLYDGMCSVTQADVEQGLHTLTVLADAGTVDEMRLAYPDGRDIVVAGRTGFIGGQDLYVDTSAGPIAFFAILPDEAMAAGMQTSDITIPVAELVVAAIEAGVAAE